MELAGGERRDRTVQLAGAARGVCAGRHERAAEAGAPAWRAGPPMAAGPSALPRVPRHSCSCSTGKKRKAQCHTQGVHSIGGAAQIRSDEVRRGTAAAHMYTQHALAPCCWQPQQLTHLRAHRSPLSGAPRGPSTLRPGRHRWTGEVSVRPYIKLASSRGSGRDPHSRPDQISQPVLAVRAPGVPAPVPETRVRERTRDSPKSAIFTRNRSSSRMLRSASGEGGGQRVLGQRVLGQRWPAQCDIHTSAMLPSRSC